MMKVLKYSGLILAGLLLDFFCILGVVVALWGDMALMLISVALVTALFGFLHSCLCKIIRKDLSITIIWYTIVVQLLPIAAAASSLIVVVYKRNTIDRYDFKGLNQTFAIYCLITFVMMLFFSFLFNRVMKGSRSKQSVEELGSNPDERQV